MKKIFLSNIFKAAVMLMCTLCSVLITHTVINAFITESQSMGKRSIDYPTLGLIGAINNQTLDVRNHIEDINEEPEIGEYPLDPTPNVGTQPSISPQPDATEVPIITNVLKIERMAKSCSDMVDYYISVPSQNILITNQENFDENKFVEAKYTSMSKRINGQTSEYGNINGGLMTPSGTADYQFYIALKQSYVDSYEGTNNSNGFGEYNSVEAENFLWKLTVLGALLLAGILCLIIAAGRKYNDDEVHMCSLDKIKVEINLVLLAAVICAIFGYALFVDSFTHEKLPLYCSLAVGIGFVLCAILGLSLVRQLKNRSFCENTVISLIWRKIKRLFGRFINGKHMKFVIQSMAKDKYGIAYIAASVIYIALVILNPFTAFIATVLLAYLIVRRMSDLYRIRHGVEEICGGNTEHKIEDCKFPDYKLISEKINEMGDGMKDAIDRRVRSERMKAELITNVSHDLKTPLTSIISYAKLLEELNPEPAEARDYVAVIQKKGEQLKKLSTELFDISKAQSGNAEVNIEKLDINLLINQALGELNGDIIKSGLEFIVKTEGELFINADGKKLSRVFENLIVNILKYSLKGTRVFINTSESEGRVTAAFRNISEKPLNFDAEEITERFVRGDSSRTGDGNGLGLAIAKSYTELCGGSFKITIDGDLFKAELKF